MKFEFRYITERNVEQFILFYNQTKIIRRNSRTRSANDSEIFGDLLDD